MKQDLQGKVLVLTGAGGGIGRAIALRMAQCGMKLVLLGGRNVSKLQETQALVEKCSQCFVLPGELTDVEALDKLVTQAASVFGGIDVRASRKARHSTRSRHRNSMQSWA